MPVKTFILRSKLRCYIRCNDNETIELRFYGWRQKRMEQVPFIQSKDSSKLDYSKLLIEQCIASQICNRNAHEIQTLLPTHK